MFPRTVSPFSFIALSAFIHISLVGALLFFTPKKEKVIPFEISFSNSGIKIGEGGEASGSPPSSRIKKVVSTKAQKPETASKDDVPVVKKQTHKEIQPPVREQKVVSAQKQRPQEHQEQVEGNGKGTGTGDGKGNGFGGLDGQGFGSGSGGSNSYLAKYGTSVAQLIEKNKRYPALAKRLGQQGKVVIKITIDKNGKLVTTEVVEGSPYKSLATASVETIKTIKSFPPLPKELASNEISFNVPINYHLEM